MIRDLMTQQARLALEAFGTGDVARYELHRANARRLADHLQLQEAQEQRRSPQFRPDYGIEGPDHEDDFLKQENALTAILRYGVPLLLFLICLAFLAGYAGRRLGFF